MRGAAIGVDDLPGDEGGRVRGQEQRGADQVFRRLGARNALHGDDAFLLRRRHGLALDLGEGRARQDRIDGDVVGAELARHRPAHADQRGFRRDVMQIAGPAERHRAGGHVDDAAPFGAPHRRQHGARTQHRAGDVDAQHLFPFLERNLLERAHLQRREDSGIVDQHVDAAVFVLDQFDHFVDRGRVGDVGGDRQRLAIGLEDLRGDRGGGFLVALGDDDARAGQREGLGEDAADALAGAGDDDDAVLQSGKHKILQIAHVCSFLTLSFRVRAHGASQNDKRLTPRLVRSSRAPPAPPARSTASTTA